MRRLPWFALAGVLAACGGEDEPPPPPPKAQPVAATPAAKPRGGATPAATVTTYSKIESRPELTPAEAKLIRHRFTAADFVTDPTGSVNRDPFRSYIITQISVNTGPAAGDPAGEDKLARCPGKRVAAVGYSTRELKLTGVVTRGTMREATFTDSAGVGWGVRRGDCIGSERARVKLIGEGFVTLEYPATGTTPDDPNARTEEREYRLRERELIDEISTALDDNRDNSLRIRRRVRSIEPPPAPSGGGQPQ